MENIFKDVILFMHLLSYVISIDDLGWELW